MTQLMNHFPVKVTLDNDVVQIDQAIDDSGSYLRIELAKEQALQLAGSINKALKAKPTQKESKFFGEFWATYPLSRRVAKTQMLNKWIARNLDAIYEEKIRPALEIQLSSPDWNKDNRKYVPMVTTYVNQSRWESVDVSSQKSFDTAL